MGSILPVRRKYTSRAPQVYFTKKGLKQYHMVTGTVCHNRQKGVKDDGDDFEDGYPLDIDE